MKVHLEEQKDWPKGGKCLCQASKHPLICNCLNCGRIVCEEDFSSPNCSWCNHALTSLGEKIGNQKANKLLKKNSALAKRDQLCQADLALESMQIHDQNVDVSEDDDEEEAREDELFLELNFDAHNRSVLASE